MIQKVSNKLLSQDFFTEFFFDFLNAEGASKKTRKNYLSDLKSFQEWLHEHTNIQALTTQTITLIERSHIEKYLLFLAQDHKAATGTRHLSALKIFFKACQSAKLITSNPAREFSFIKEHQKAVSKNKELELMEWEINRLRAGTTPEKVKTEVKDIKEFMEWINKYQNKN